MTLPISPSQTIGPFSHEAWRWACAATEGVDSTAETITISGILRDGDGNPITDGMIEAWSPAGAEPERTHALPGFRRVASGEDGGFRLTLSRAAGSGEPAALVTVFARGLVLHQFSALFLDDDPGLDGSEILRQVPPERRATLIARKTGAASYAWDINMQGALETVFFDYE
jgi:protocatechuate 3,4-dioxygenase alpha subunit